MTIRFDYRQGRRLYLKHPAPAMITGGRARIIDVGLESIGVEHDFPVERNAPVFIEFSWSRTPISLSCVVARTREVKEQAGVYRSGLRIKGVNDQYLARVKEALRKQRELERTLPPAI